MNKLEKELWEYMPRTLEINTMEELAELQQAISKVFRYGANIERRSNLIEEIADVMIMISYITEKYKIHEEVISFVMSEKVKRLRERIVKDLEETGGSL